MRDSSLDKLEATRRYIEAFNVGQGHGPTIKEIAKGCGLTYTAAWNRVGRLEQAALIKVDRGPRGYRRMRTIRAIENDYL